MSGASGRGLAAVAIAVVLVLTAVAAEALVALSLQGKAEEVEARRAELEALMRRPLGPRREGEQSAPPVDPFLEGATLALAANRLQERVVALVEATRGKLLTVGIDPPTTPEDEASRRVLVQATAEMTVEALQTLLYRLESEAPFVFVDSLIVQTTAREGAAEGASRVLRVDLRVAGYWRGATS